MPWPTFLLPQPQHTRLFPSHFRPLHLETFSTHSAVSSPLSVEKMMPLDAHRLSPSLNHTQFSVQSFSLGPRGEKLGEEGHLHALPSQPHTGAELLVLATVAFLSPGTAAHRGGSQHGSAKSPCDSRTMSHVNPPPSQPTNRGPKSALVSSPLPQASCTGSWAVWEKEKNRDRKEERGRKARAHVTMKGDLSGKFGETVAGEKQGGSQRRE